MIGTQKLKALQYRSFGSLPELVDIDIPEPGPSQIRLRVTAAGICHSDLHLMDMSEEEYPYKPLPLTMGHEIAGVVDKLGSAVTGVELGESVLVYGSWGCGRCYQCAKGNENNCQFDDRPPGVYFDGGMAEYMIVNNARHLVSLGDLDPVANVALTDAGVTSYRAVKSALPTLTPGTTAVVIGVGGLGHVAVQLLKALTQSTVIALDLGDEQLQLATEMGADHTFKSDPAALEPIKALTGGRGVDAVFDFVGVQSTGEMAASLVAKAGQVVVVGYGGGAVPIGPTSVAYDVTAYASNWGSRTDLMDVVELARRGAISIHVEKYSISQGADAYRKMKDGAIRGRAVIVPSPGGLRPLPTGPESFIH